MNSTKKGQLYVHGVFFQFQLTEGLPNISDTLKVSYMVESEEEVNRGTFSVPTESSELVDEGKETERMVVTQATKEVPKMVLEMVRTPKTLGSFKLYCRLTPSRIKKSALNYVLETYWKGGAQAFKAWPDFQKILDERPKDD